MTPEQYEKSVYVEPDGTMWVACDPYPHWFRRGAYGEIITAWDDDRDTRGWLAKAGPASLADDGDGTLFTLEMPEEMRNPNYAAPALITIGLGGTKIYRRRVA